MMRGFGSHSQPQRYRHTRDRYSATLQSGPDGCAAGGEIGRPRTLDFNVAGDGAAATARVRGGRGPIRRLFAGVAPFAKVRLPEGDGFIPAVHAIIAVTNLTTALLLFTKFSLLRLRALLALANAYLFCALIVLVHLLTFPGAFAPLALLVPSLQTAGWLYFVWHIGFPAAVIAYVLLSDGAGAKSRVGGSPRMIIGCSIVGLVALVCAVLWFLMAADRVLPRSLRCWSARGPCSTNGSRSRSAPRQPN